MTIGSYRRNERQYFEHAVYGLSGTTTDTAVALGTAAAVFGPVTTTTNQCVARAMEVRYVGLHTATAAVTVAGNWTLSLWINATFPAPAATFTFNPVTANDTFFGEFSNPVQLDPGETWWVGAQGPERNIMIIRGTIGCLLL